MTRGIQETLKDYSRFFDSFLEHVIFPEIRDLAVEELAEPCIYSLSAGGKRIRPVIALMSAGYPVPDGGVFDTLEMDRVLLQNPQSLAPLFAAAALESLHTYSLIHDDLPAMDDDDLRRGRKSCHREFTEWQAILAGDALNAYAFQLLNRASSDPSKLGMLLQELALAGGMWGMISGQALDLRVEKVPSSVMPGDREWLLTTIHTKKTAAMIRASMVMGALSGGASSTEKANEYGEKLGLLFQITDDILDVTASTEELGKTAGKDEKSGKLTYPGLFGLERTKEIASKLTDELQKLSKALGEDPNTREDSGSSRVSDFFFQLPQYILSRKK